MAKYFISDCALIDGTGAPARPGSALLIDGERIKAIGTTSSLRGQADGYEHIDAGGRTVMPGLIEGHVHLNFCNPRTTLEIDDKWPAQFMGMMAASNAQKLLAAGYTAGVSGGAQFAVDVWVKRAIRMGFFRGPRLLSCTRPISTTGGDGDWHPPWRKILDPMAYVADGPAEMLKAARLLLKDGADALKIFTSGEGSRVAEFHPQLYDCSQHRETMLFEEIKAATDEAHRWERPVVAHTRDTVSIKNCIRAGVDIILHATYLDDAGLEMMVKSPPRGVVPAMMPPKLFLQGYRDGRIPRAYYEASGYEEDWASGKRAMKRLHDRGIRVVPGGEYGLFGMPYHGENAKDLQLFVEDIGFTPMETLCAATRDAAYLMGMEKDLGTLEEGKLADLLVVDADPLRDITALQVPENISIVVQNGEIQAREGKLLPL